jgi:hypothetical protein
VAGGTGLFQPTGEPMMNLPDAFAFAVFCIAGAAVLIFAKKERK